METDNLIPGQIYRLLPDTGDLNCPTFRYISPHWHRGFHTFEMVDLKGMPDCYIGQAFEIDVETIQKKVYPSEYFRKLEDLIP